MPISVAIIEDDLVLRDHMAQIISNSPLCELMGVASDWLASLEIINGNNVDVFLVDLGLPDCSGLDLIKIITTRSPESQVMVMSAFGDTRHILKSFEAGATGYIMKTDATKDLVNRVVQLHNGESPVSGSVAKILIKKILNSPTEEMGELNVILQDKFALTERDLQIYLALNSNLTAKEISKKFSISFHTANNHIRSIYKKLGVNSRMGALTEIKKYSV